jgi:Fungal chitosanase of glycosyl hydrolase group 75
MAFRPPAASKRQLDGVPFDLATDFAADARARFAAADRRPGNRDPSKCKALLKFPDNDGPGAVFWSAKMAIDTDGPSAGPGHLNGKQLDPNPGVGRIDTSMHLANGAGLPSEAVPYIVLPQREAGSNKTFDPAVAIGDVAVVIFKDKTAAAVCGDLGPFNKIGEASIRVHEGLQQQGCPDPCTRRNDRGFCLKARNASVEQDVLYFVFPNSAFGLGELTLENINTKVKERAFALYNKLRGAS